MFESGDEIDKRLTWPLGRSERLARRGKLPHVLLPDGSIRFEWVDIEQLIVRMPAHPTEQRQHRAGGPDR
jgi:hypothetical protein